ncbi:LysR family transcriptional regulator [Paraburkholderia silviterrae]|uniref:LysR family transcriptional regulator n=1 Tax=Paraburkholderia silviterrae TaxID=2528715 RepID=A0A4R5M1F9_9BURK|nr:LysR family transcriptional regulator [Paraburkholderia silviterrae]
MDRLMAMQVFTKVVEMNGFARAADALGVPPASATTLIQKLEAHLQVRLMQRTTRRISLTPEGAEYYERCVRILEDIDETEDSLTHTAKGPRGKLRVDMPSSLGRVIVMPRIEEFRARYPDVELMLGFGDRPVDLIQEGVDCALRVGQLEDSSLVARRLGALTTMTAASPAYLERYGEPHSLEALEQHIAVQYFSNRTGRIAGLNFMVDGKSTDMKMNGTLAVNDADAYVTCGVNGAGIIQAPWFMLLSHLEAGELKEILTPWKVRPMPLSAVYPHNRHLAAKVRVFVEWIAELCEQTPLAFTHNWSPLADDVSDAGPAPLLAHAGQDFAAAGKMRMIKGTGIRSAGSMI